jgi:hypothetical protein
MNIWEIMPGVLTGLGAAIPLVIQLVKYIRENAKEKNWQKLLVLVQSLIADAESDTNLSDGAARKAWVLEKVMALSGVVDYNVDIDEVGNLIDGLVELTKKVNISVKELHVSSDWAKKQINSSNEVPEIEYTDVNESEDES